MSTFILPIAINGDKSTVSVIEDLCQILADTDTKAWNGAIIETENPAIIAVAKYLYSSPKMVPPPAVTVAARKNGKPPVMVRKCLHCGKEFTARRRDQLYDSKVCYQAGHAKAKAEPVATKTKTNGGGFTYALGNENITLSELYDRVRDRQIEDKTIIIRSDGKEIVVIQDPNDKSLHLRKGAPHDRPGLPDDLDHIDTHAGTALPSCAGGG